MKTMDQAIVLFFNSWLKRHLFLQVFVSILAINLIYLIPPFLILYWFLGEKKVALRAVLAGLLAWQGLARLIGWLYFRPRPFVALPTWEWLFHRPDYSFPSDHATFLSALAVSFYLAGEKRVGLGLAFLTLSVSLARLVVGFHYPTDLLAGWLLGGLVAVLTFYLKELIDRFFCQPIIRLAQKLHLA